jgi:L-ascorbate metabolism protein UlaG (beta-lactamase superfamily)
MKIHQIRNATIIVTYNNKRFLIDPWLMPASFMPCFDDFLNRFDFALAHDFIHKINIFDGI